jgi:predicted nuclease with TOPRIM domain
MVRTSMTRLAEHIDDHQFQISALMKRVKELETAETTQATDLSNNNYAGRANVRWLSERITKLEHENTALSDSLHRDRKSYESTYRDLIKRLRELERIAHTAPITFNNPPQSEREKITEVIHDITQSIIRIEKILGTHGG